MSLKIEKKRIWHAIRRFSISFIMLAITAILIILAPNYEKNNLSDRVNLIINNNNITKSLKSDIIIEDDKIYLSFADVENFFDEYLTVENNKIIATSHTKTASIPIDGGRIYQNGTNLNIDYKIINKNDNYYLPMDLLSQIYNYEMNYDENEKIITVDSLDRKAVKAVASKDLNVKYMPTIFSKNVDKAEKGETLTIIQNSGKEADIRSGGWIKIRSGSGVIGYVKEADISDIETIREATEKEKINGKVSIVWDYYNQYNVAPTRTETIKGINVVSPSFFELRSDGSLAVNVGESGTNYIKWARENNIEVWPVLSNSMLNDLEAVSNILSTFESRDNLIENIIKELDNIDVQGLYVDFENMKKSDIDNYSRFIIELAPRLREKSKRLTVLLTAPDGSDTWSLCYDRNTIGKVADYVVFMGYDQTPGSSKVPGTVAGADWVELNIKKFLGQEEVSKDKLILSMPFYTRLWMETDGVLTSRIVNMKDIEIPEGTEVKWDEKLKQNYIEYTIENTNYKMWIEDEESISAKLDLVNSYGLAGAGFWEKDRENENIWNIVEEKLK